MPGTATARLIESASEALRIYDAFRGRREAITILLNGVDAVDPTVLDLQELFHVPYSWRRGDTVATLSMRGAGIGFHAGREDGFIVQLRGSREWTVWSPGVVSPHYVRALCGHPDNSPPPSRPTCRPLLRCVLRRGDALYVPALFPHEGVTRTESLSLSLAWQGLVAYEVLTALNRPRRCAAAPDARLFRLLADPPHGAEHAAFLAAEISILAPLAARRVAAMPRIERFVQALIARGLR